MHSPAQQLGIKIFSWLLVIVLFVLVAISQYWLDLQKTSRGFSQVEYNILIEPKTFSSDFIKKIDLGFHQLIADFLWLDTIQYFGSGDYTKRYRALPKLLETITDLDRQFTQPYLFGMLVMPYQKDVDSAIALGEKGLKNNPDVGMIPYYLGAIYHMEKKNYQRAAEVYAIAAEKPDTPAAAKVLAGVSLSQFEEKQAALAWWQGILEKADPDSYQYKRAQVWLEHVKLQIQLEELVKLYQEKNSRMPENLDTFVEEGILPEIPKSPLGVKFFLDPDSGKVLYRKSR